MRPELSKLEEHEENIRFVDQTIQDAQKNLGILPDRLSLLPEVDPRFEGTLWGSVNIKRLGEDCQKRGSWEPLENALFTVGQRMAYFSKIEDWKVVSDPDPLLNLWTRALNLGVGPEQNCMVREDAELYSMDGHYVIFIHVYGEGSNSFKLKGFSAVGKRMFSPIARTYCRRVPTLPMMKFDAYKCIDRLGESDHPGKELLEPLQEVIVSAREKIYPVRKEHVGKTFIKCLGCDKPVHWRWHNPSTLGAAKPMCRGCNNLTREPKPWGREVFTGSPSKDKTKIVPAELPDIRRLSEKKTETPVKKVPVQENQLAQVCERLEAELDALYEKREGLNFEIQTKEAALESVKETISLLAKL